MVVLAAVNRKRRGRSLVIPLVCCEWVVPWLLPWCSGRGPLRGVLVVDLYVSQFHRPCWVIEL